jgi:polysaccharide export outer membrane protein
MGALLAAAVTAGCASARFGARTGERVSNAAGPVRPGDQVALKVWSEPDMSGTFGVSDAGEVAMPKLGRVAVAGMPAGEVQDSLRRAMLQYVREPSLDVSVLRRVAIMGEVRTPGVYFVDLTNTASDVIARAGGLMEGANADEILIRRGDSTLVVSQFDPSIQAAGVRSGDEIVVRPKSFWTRNPPLVISTLTSAVSLVLLVATNIWRR